jgi:hypothetical protein
LRIPLIFLTERKIALRGCSAGRDPAMMRGEAGPRRPALAFRESDDPIANPAGSGMFRAVVPVARWAIHLR